MFYNFCKIHPTLRVTPAMEAKIDDHVWYGRSRDDGGYNVLAGDRLAHSFGAFTCGSDLFFHLIEGQLDLSCDFLTKPINPSFNSGHSIA